MNIQNYLCEYSSLYSLLPLHRAQVCTNNAGVYDLGKHTTQGRLSAGWRLWIDHATRNAISVVQDCTVYIQHVQVQYSTCCAPPSTVEAKL